MKIPSLGRVVMLVLSATMVSSAADLVARSEGALKANAPKEGEVYPMTIARVWTDPTTPATPATLVNGFVQLDGNFGLWVTSVHQSDGKEPGTWHFPAIKNDRRTLSLVSLEEEAGRTVLKAIIDGTLSASDYSHLMAGVTARRQQAADNPVSAEESARAAYTAYSAAVGGIAFNGDPLPDWETFSADPVKEKQAKAWIEAARAVHSA